MTDAVRRYRKKPLASFENGTRIYAPSAGEDCFRVIVITAAGQRCSYKFKRENDARGKARELEAYLASNTPLHGRKDQDRTVRALSKAYMEHISGKSTRYRERQDSILRCWVLPLLADTSVGDWTPAMSEKVLTKARKVLAPTSVQNIGSCMRSLVTFAYKSRWLPREVDPMWLVSYSPKPEYQGQVAGFVPRVALPGNEQCGRLFEGFEAIGEPSWALAMKLKHRCGARWGELIALRPRDIEFEPYRVVHIDRAVEQTTAGRSIKATKNEQKRTSVFPASLAEELARHVEAVRRADGDEALLFTLKQGEPAERRQFLRLWIRAAKHAGWPMKTRNAARWHPHDLRHVAACWMLFDVHLDPAFVSRMLGHANPAFTLSRYVGVRTGADAATNEMTATW